MTSTQQPQWAFINLVNVTIHCSGPERMTTFLVCGGVFVGKGIHILHINKSQIAP